MANFKVKNNWNQASGFFDFKKACSFSDSLRLHFTFKRGIDVHPEQWDHMVYLLIKGALLEPFSIVFGPNNRPYLKVYVPSREELEENFESNDGVEISMVSKPFIKMAGTADKAVYKNFTGVCKNAIDNFAGIALYVSKDQLEPNMTIRFGALYSYMLHGDVGGTPELIENMIQAIKTNRKNPRQAIANINDKSYVEIEPSETFFNDFLCTCIRQELRKVLKDNEIEISFVLREQAMYVMRYMILLSFSNLNQDINPSSLIQIMQNLTWYMPLYLPLACKDINGVLDVFY